MDDTQKDDRADNFRTGRLRSNHEQSIQHTGKIKNSDDYLSDKCYITSGCKSKIKTLRV